MKIWISGASGYIGVNLIKLLQELECDYFNYDLTYGYDILNDGQVRKTMKGCDSVIHLAAQPNITYCEKNIEEAVETNVYGTVVVARVAKYYDLPVVFISTIAAKTAHNVYGLTKRLAEKIVLNNGGVVLRLANVYGGLGYLSRKNTALASFINHRAKGLEATIYGDGSATRDFIHIEDVCQAIVHGLTAPPGVYEICTGRQVSIKELADMVGVTYKHASERAGDISNIPMEPSIEALGWSPMIQLEEGLEELKK